MTDNVAWDGDPPGYVGRDRPLAVQVRGLTKMYRRRAVLRDLNLNMERSSIYGLLGLNGAGKSTLLRCLVGWCRPTSGEVMVLGHRLPGDYRRVSNRCGIAIELPAFYPFLSGRENLEELMIARTGFRDRESVGGALTQAGLADAACKHVGAYSKGMRQRLAVAASLLGGPELLLLDEPTEGLDPFGRHDIRALLSRLRAGGQTVLFSSHVLAEVEEVADRVGILHQGRLVAEGSPKEIVDLALGPRGHGGLEDAFVHLVERQGKGVTR